MLYVSDQCNASSWQNAAVQTAGYAALVDALCPTRGCACGGGLLLRAGHPPVGSAIPKLGCLSALTCVRALHLLRSANLRADGGRYVPAAREHPPRATYARGGHSGANVKPANVGVINAWAAARAGDLIALRRAQTLVAASETIHIRIAPPPPRCLSSLPLLRARG
eukprot:COSAG02_NODE_9568_length_2177_cov_1.125120_2_plen_166_part_00